MPPDLQLLGTVCITWCLDDGLGLLVNFVFPTVCSNEAPTREASVRHVDKYVASVCDRLRTTLQEVQAQSMVEAHWQKQYYDRKIGTVNLNPGDLILVKVDACKGKRKIKDRWEEETWEVVCQIATDIPSYKVTNQHGKSRVLHWNQLLLIASEVGVPLCMGNCHTWDRCTSLTPCKTTSVRGGRKWMPQENNGKVVTQWPTSKSFPGVDKWKVAASTVDTYQSIHRRWVKTTGNDDVAADLRRNMYIRQREWCQSPLMPAVSEPNKECDHSQNWVTVGKAKQNKGGSEMGK